MMRKTIYPQNSCNLKKRGFYDSSWKLIRKHWIRQIKQVQILSYDTWLELAATAHCFESLSWDIQGCCLLY